MPPLGGGRLTQMGELDRAADEGRATGRAEPGRKPSPWQYVAVLKAVRLSGFAVLSAAGALLAGMITAGGRAAEQTTTEQTTIIETTTAPGTTETVQQTTTRRVIVPTTGTTTSASNTDNGTPDWVWVVIGVLALGLIALLVVLLTRREGGTVPAEERQRRLDSAVGSWTMHGWAIDNQTADSAILRRGNELMQVSVDPAGHITTRPLPVAGVDRP
jgi:hypothetical protein